MSVELRMSVLQELRGANVGCMRRCNAIRNDLTSQFLYGSQWEKHIEGACAELAASIVLGLPWTGEHVFMGKGEAVKLPDLGDSTEVRWSASKNPCLWFNPQRDRDDWDYVLVTGFAPTYTVHGHLLGSQLQRREWRREAHENFSGVLCFAAPLAYLDSINAQAVMAV